MKWNNNNNNNNNIFRNVVLKLFTKCTSTKGTRQVNCPSILINMMILMVIGFHQLTSRIQNNLRIDYTSFPSNWVNRQFQTLNDLCNQGSPYDPTNASTSKTVTSSIHAAKNSTPPIKTLKG